MKPSEKYKSLTEYWLAGKVSPVSSEAGGWRARYPAYLNNEGQQQSPPKKNTYQIILIPISKKSKARYPAYLSKVHQKRTHIKNSSVMKNQRQYIQPVVFYCLFTVFNFPRGNFFVSQPHQQLAR